jgi:hypothetical protein
MRCISELYERIPDAPDVINERRWSVETREGTKEVIALHSPNWRAEEVAVVADGQIVARLKEDFSVERRREIAFDLAGRSCVATFELVVPFDGTRKRPIEQRFAYDLFVDGRSVVNGRTLGADRDRVGPALPRGGKAILLTLAILQMSGAAGVSQALLSDGANVAAITLTLAVFSATTVAGHSLATRALRRREWTDARRLVAGVLTLIGTLVALGLGMVAVFTATR